MTITDPWHGAYRVGSSLQHTLRLTLGGANHGGVTVTVTSSDANKLRLAPNATTAGDSNGTLNIAFADGETYKISMPKACGTPQRRRDSHGDAGTLHQRVNNDSCSSAGVPNSKFKHQYNHSVSGQRVLCKYRGSEHGRDGGLVLGGSECRGSIAGDLYEQ